MVLVGSAAPVRAGYGAGVTILSGQQQVWGYAKATWDDDEYVPHLAQDQYDLSSPWSGTGLFGSAEVDVSETWVWSRTGPLNVQVESKAWRWQDPGGDYPYPAYSASYAEANWAFRPETSVLLLQTDTGGTGIWRFDWVELSIWDWTAGRSLIDYSNYTGGLFAGGDWTGPWVRDGGFTVDPTHMYGMYVFLERTANDDGPWHLGIHAWCPSSPIPAPGAAALSLLGAGAVGWLRRHRDL